MGSLSFCAKPVEPNVCACWSNKYSLLVLLDYHNNVDPFQSSLAIVSLHIINAQRVIVNLEIYLPNVLLCLKIHQYIIRHLYIYEDA